MFEERELAWAAGRLSVDHSAAERLPETLPIQLDLNRETLGANSGWPGPNKLNNLCVHWRPLAILLSISL